MHHAGRARIGEGALERGDGLLEQRAEWPELPEALQRELRVVARQREAYPGCRHVWLHAAIGSIGRRKDAVSR